MGNGRVMNVRQNNLLYTARQYSLLLQIKACLQVSACHICLWSFYTAQLAVCLLTIPHSDCAVPQIARRYNLLLHVDACLGGFVLPFARKLGYPIPPFDFSVKGVTSMSVDTHKFGMAHKGTSVVLYHSKELRQYQYTKITEWTGGLYISPGKLLMLQAVLAVLMVNGNSDDHSKNTSIW